MPVRFLILLSTLAVCAWPTTSLAQTSPPSAVSPAKISAPDIAELRTKAEAGDASASFELGRAYETGNGIPANPEQAVVWYRKAAEQGNAKAQNSLGVLYWMGNGVVANKVEAVQWYRKSARQGDASAMFNLGAAYYDGEGVNVNDNLAYAWFLLSSEAGSGSGQDAAKRTAGEHGLAALNEACFRIGKMYETGEDLPANTELAARWYRKAAERGYSEAKIGLAILSMKAKDFGEARHWCEAAAKDRHAGGYFCLGHLYQHGLGVEQSPNEARKWYEESAKAGHAQGMQALGQMYEKGEGTKVDRSQAFVWYFISARRGNGDAVLAANQLRSLMTASEWKDAQKKLRQRNFDLKQVDVVLHGSPEPVR